MQYIPSKCKPLPIYEGNTELRMMDLANQLEQVAQVRNKRRRQNLTNLQRRLSIHLQKDHHFIVCLMGFLGPAILERETYIQ
jgi:hypothetical protein